MRVPSIDVVLRGGEGGLLCSKREYPGGDGVDGMVVQLRLESLDMSAGLDKSGVLDIGISLRSLALAHVLSGDAGASTYTVRAFLDSGGRTEGCGGAIGSKADARRGRDKLDAM